MKATCPNCGCRRFITVVHLTEDWLVEENGDLVDVAGDGEVVHGPNPDNTWTCHDCGAQAKVTNA